MPVARDLFDLQRRLDRYFWFNSSESHQKLTRIMHTSFGRFEEIGVLGGLVRDFAREGRAGFRSDVDLVIDAPESEVAFTALRLGARRNIFGGYSHRELDWKVDFWALETTWAFRQKLVKVSNLADVVKCTFFDWDSALYHLGNRRLICDQNYVDRIKSKVIDINLEINPAPRENLFRALRRIILWDLIPGPRLQRFIGRHMSEDVFLNFKHLERNTTVGAALRRYRHVDDLLYRVLLHRDIKERKENTKTPIIHP